MIRNNIISKNTSDVYGGGIYCDGLKSRIINNNIVSANHAYAWGGGIYFTCQSVMINNTLYGNSATIGGGGIFVYIAGPGDLEVRNSIFWSNTAPTGSEVYLDEYADLTVSHCDVKGGLASVHVEPGGILNWGSGMIDADPLLVDTVNDDFHLTFPSPCRDAGVNSAVIELYDFEGDPRIAYGTADMGADEFYTHLYWTGDATPGGNVVLKFLGLPGTAPVQLWLGSGVLDPPWPTKYGDWYLQFPLLVTIPNLGAIPSNGVLTFPFTFPAATPTPLSLPFQSGIGMELTNPTLMSVE